jgi:hypothetical protein
MSPGVVHLGRIGFVTLEESTMFRSLRFSAVLLSSAIVFAAGCEKSGVSGTGASGGTQPGAGKADGAGKKLVGTWEGTDEDMKDKDGKPLTVTLEFKADGKMAIKMGGPFDMDGTWKVAKEEGKTLTVDTEMTFPDFGGKGPGKSDKETLTIAFENDNTIVITHSEKKGPKPQTLKRKT